jgi:hypothetical protein
MLNIAQEQDHWHNLSNHIRNNKAGVMVKTEQLMPLPDKVQQQSPYWDTVWQVNTYDVEDHSVIRSVLRPAYEDMTKKTPSARLRTPATGGSRQQGVHELPRARAAGLRHHHSDAPRGMALVSFSVLNKPNKPMLDTFQMLRDIYERHDRYVSCCEARIPRVVERV